MASEGYIGWTEPIKNYYVSTEAWTAVASEGYIGWMEPIKNYYLSAEAWTAEQVFYPVSEQEECPAASEEYIGWPYIYYFHATQFWRLILWIYRGKSVERLTEPKTKN